MKLHQDRHDVERIGINKESTFTIKTTAKAFDILSSGLYSDKILAVVRELSCNAVDAQTDAGKKNEPFEIHLPNSLEPYFSVKDNGIGLSDDQVHGLYTTYFDSTKTDSNDFIGALGLGSKSPFSYTKSFEVISRHDGKKRLYGIFINEDGIPTVALMNTVDTDECNGLEVKITVHKDDFYKFEDKVKEALRYFNVKPTITGNSRFSWPEYDDEVVLSGNGWEMRKCNWRDRGKVIGIQGGVAYKIQSDLLDNLSKTEKNFLEKTFVVMHFKIGDLEVAASREELQYDPRTKENIKNRINEVQDEVKNILRKTIRNHKGSYWTLVIRLNELSSDLFGNRDALCEVIDAQNVRSIALRRYIQEDGRLEFKPLKGHEVVTYTRSYKNSGRPSRSEHSHYVTPQPEVIVMFNDVKVGGVQRIGHYLDSQPNKHVVAIKQLKLEGKFNFEREYKRLLKDLGDPIVQLVSELPSVRRNRSGFAGGVYLYRGEPIYRYPYNVRWNQSSVDFEEGGFYFKLKDRKYIMNNDNHEIRFGSDFNDDIRKVLALVKLHEEELGIDYDSLKTDTIYGANIKAQKQIEKEDNWYNIFDMLDQLAPKFLADAQYLRSWSITQDKLEFAEIADNEHFRRILVSLDKDDKIKQMFDPILSKVEQAQYSRNAISILRTFGYEFNTDECKPIINVETDFREKYPMLKYVGRYSRLEEHEVEDVLEYIALIDRGEQ